MSGNEEEKSVTTVVISAGYITVGMSVLVYAVRVSSSVRDPAVRSHMFVQNG